MRKILFILCLLLTQQGFGQNAALQLTSMNVVYIGLKNPFKLAGNGLSAENLVYQTQNCKVTLNGLEGTNEVADGRECKVYIGKVLKRDTVWTDTFEFRVRRVPEPTYSLGSLIEGEGKASVGKILAQTKLFAYVPNLAHSYVRYQVDSLTIILAYRDSISVERISSHFIRKSSNIVRLVEKHREEYNKLSNDSLWASNNFYGPYDTVNQFMLVINNIFYSPRFDRPVQKSRTYFEILSNNSNPKNVPHFLIKRKQCITNLF